MTTTKKLAPQPAEIRARRESLRLSQTVAAGFVWHSVAAWQKWEHGSRRMHPSTWELFNIKTAELK